MIEQLLKSMPNNTKTCSGCQIECCVTNIPTQCEPLAIKHTGIGIGGGQGPPNFQQAAIRLLSYNFSAVGPVGYADIRVPSRCTLYLDNFNISPNVN